MEEKIREYGLENKLKGSLTGGTTDLNKDSKTNKYSKPTTTGKITSPYGERMHPVYKTKKFHDGIDIGVPIGTPVNATTDGIVKK